MILKCNVFTNIPSVPDARGMFFRSANNARSDGLQNPDNTVLGGYQSDEFKAHTHGISAKQETNSGGNAGIYSGSPGGIVCGFSTTSS